MRKTRLGSGATSTSGRRTGFNRRDFMRGAAGAGIGLAGLSRLPFSGVAQDEIPLTPSTATVDGTLQVLQKLDFHPDHNKFIKEEIARFAEASGWSVEVSEVGSLNSSEVAQRLVAGVQAGNAPDLYFDNVPVRLFQDLGIFKDVTALVEEVEATNGRTTPAMENGAHFNDAWWGVPWFTRVDGWWARNDIFTPAGIDVATLTALDERREAALQVSDPANNMFGWGITTNRSTDARALIQAVLIHFGSTLQDESGDYVTFNSPESVQAIEWLYDTYTNEKWKPMLPIGWEAWTDTGNNEMFLAGNLALTQNAGTMYAKAVLDQVPFAGDIAYMPNALRLSDQQPVDQLGGVLLHVIEGTKNEDAVNDLIRHLLSEGVQQRIWTISMAYAVPAYFNGWDDPIIVDNDNASRARAATWDNETFTGLRWPGPPSVAVDAVGGGFDQVDLVAEVLQGKPAAQAVEEYADRWVTLWQDYGLPGSQ